MHERLLTIKLDKQKGCFIYKNKNALKHIMSSWQAPKFCKKMQYRIFRLFTNFLPAFLYSEVSFKPPILFYNAENKASVFKIIANYLTQELIIKHIKMNKH